MTLTSLLSVCVLFAITVTMAQDMRENCVSCGDTQRLCEIDCMLPTYRESVTVAWPNTQPETYVQMTSCLSICTKKASICVETPEQTACLSCMTNCSYIYEAGMLECLQSIADVSSKATVDDTMDDCSNNASTTMSICAETCYEKDVYLGWTPSTEEGIAETLGSVKLTVPDFRTPLTESIEEVAVVEDLKSQRPPPITTMSNEDMEVEDVRRGEMKIDQHSHPPPSSSESTLIAEKGEKNPELIQTDSSDMTADEQGSLGLSGVIGVSGLFATVIVSVGLLTKTGLVKARLEFEGSYQNKRPEIQKMESMRTSY